MTRSPRFVRGGLLLLFLLSALPVVSEAAAVEAAPGDSGAEPVLVFSTFESHGMSQLFERILREAYARIGYAAAFVEVPAERALVMSNQGRVDGEAGRVSVIERRCPNLIRVPTPIYTNRVVAFGHRSVAYAGAWSDLAPYRVGSVLGYKFVDKMTANLNRTLVSDYAKLFNMLINGRIDVAVVEYFDVLPALRSLDLKTIQLLQPPLAYNPMYHYLNKRHADLVPRIDRAIREMQREGRLIEIQREMESELGGLACPISCPLNMERQAAE